MPITNTNEMFIVVTLFIITTATVGLILIIALIFKQRRKNGSFIDNTDKKDISPNINEDVEKNMKKIISREIEESTIRIRREIEAVQDEIIKKYQSQLNAITQEIKPTFLKNFQGLDGEAKKLKKQIDDFNQTISKTRSEVIESGTGAQKEISKNIQEKIDELTKETKEEIFKIKEANLKARNSIIDEAGKEFEDLAKELDNKFSQIYRTTQDILSAKVKRAEKEIESYKKERLEEIEKEIYQIIKKVAKETIGITIDLSTHEKLLIESLRKAEKEKIL